jgi:hypothetical protein
MGSGFCGWGWAGGARWGGRRERVGWSFRDGLWRVRWGLLGEGIKGGLGGCGVWGAEALKDGGGGWCWLVDGVLSWLCVFRLCGFGWVLGWCGGFWGLFFWWALGCWGVCVVYSRLLEMADIRGRPLCLPKKRVQEQV